MLLSHDGYSVTDLATGERLVRDRDYDQAYRAVSEDRKQFSMGVNGEVVELFGLWGGEGRHDTADDWRLEVTEPGPRVLLLSRENSSYELQDQFAGSYRACGFSPSGRHIAIIDSATTQIHTRLE